MKRTAPAVARNRDPLLAVLGELLPPNGTVLEIASGTGEHCVYFARAFPALRFQPSDVGDEQLASIEAWRQEAQLDNVLPALCIDACAEQWPAPPVEVVFCANMIHIAPPAAMHGLVRGAARHLTAGGLLVTYGPYRVDGRHTAPSNEQFEAWLKAQDPDYGVRDQGELSALAASAGLHLQRAVPMPANNFTLVFAKGEPG